MISFGFLRRTLPAFATLLAASAAAVSSVQAVPAQQFSFLTNFSVAGEVAEISAATPDGRYVLYTDSEREEIGFVDITNPASPVQLGEVEMPGEPTSVAVMPGGQIALACVRDSNALVVIELQYGKSRSVKSVSKSSTSLVDAAIIATLPLNGQPDSIAISPHGFHAAIAIENERQDDEAPMPQSPSGYLQIVDLIGKPNKWKFRSVSFDGLPARFPYDVEPEFVSINRWNVAAITLQENNHIALVHLPTGLILNHFSAGTTTHAADLTNGGGISFTQTLQDALLQPDGIAWTPQGNLLTANEGDYDLDLSKGQFTGGRNFSVFSPFGPVIYDNGAQLEQAIANAGRYVDSRSDDSGVEPEGAAVAYFGGRPYAFIGAERAASVGVYRLDDESNPTFVQILPTGSRPEGLLPIPQRNLFVTSNEGDGTLSIFQFGTIDD